MERTIAGFHQDDEGEWVAELSCGHNQHVRHRPPFQLRAWVLESEGRGARLGTAIECPLCDRSEPAADEGGDRACWAGLLCPECGAVLDGGPHRQGCPTG